MRDIVDYLTPQTEEMLQLLKTMVEFESPATEKAAVDQLGIFLKRELEMLGANVDIFPQERRGDHLRATWSTNGRSAKEGAGQILILGHTDTVWPLGEVAKRPFRIERGRAYGPGIFDMKGGILMLLYALKAIKELDLPLQRKVAVILNSDEEVGSRTSRSLIEEEARQSEMVFVLEPPLSPNGAVKTSRKGVGGFQVKIRGRAAHAGVDPSMGASAVQELAHQILKLHGFTDLESGTTVNVGVVSGGIRANVVADSAQASVDLRVSSLEEGERIVKEILALKPILPGVEIEVTGGLNRPPMVRTPQIVALYQEARKVASELGLDLPEGSTGGGSDGNFTAALGVPTLDGLGAMGHGAHATHEHIVIEKLPQRTALLASLLCRVGS